MLICGFFIVLYGLKFEVQVCSFPKYERNECEPNQVPVHCDYPTKVRTQQSMAMVLLPDHPTYA